MGHAGVTSATRSLLAIPIFLAVLVMAIPLVIIGFLAWPLQECKRPLRETILDFLPEVLQ